MAESLSQWAARQAVIQLRERNEKLEAIVRILNDFDTPPSDTEWGGCVLCGEPDPWHSGLNFMAVMQDLSWHAKDCAWRMTKELFPDG